MITTVLFDLDGTLLPMDQDEFVKYYFGLLAKKVAPLGYDPKTLPGNIWSGTAAMVKNDGSCTNEAAFWKRFAAIYGEDVRKDEPVFRHFYENEFNGARAALASTPMFPAVATESRIRWAGLQPCDFELYTTYENSCHCKPNPAYFQDVAAALRVLPTECLMVGNDATEDLAAEALGMKVFLLTDCLINKDGRDITPYPQGSFDDLLRYIDSL